MKEVIEAIKANIGRVLVGKEEVTDLLLSAILAGGHVLLEDVPGTGKTMLAKSLAKSMELSFSRVQFTPDLNRSPLLQSERRIVRPSRQSGFYQSASGG